MKCKNCRREIQDDSIFCNWCGQKQLKEKNDVNVPKPHRLASGEYTGQIMKDGKRVSVKAETEAEYYKLAAEIKKGKKSPAECKKLKELIEAYIKDNTNTLSASTIRGYTMYSRNRFKDYLQKEVREIPWQKMINEESKNVSPKTIKNAWALVTASLNYAGIKYPEVNLPTVPEAETDFLDDQEIKKFLKEIKGRREEATAILALHGLRASEIYHLTAEDIRDNVIHVRGATVLDINNKRVDKDTNKNRTSTRDVPVLIPRLLELLPESGRVSTIPGTCVNARLATVCKRAGVPVCSLHDLRRSFASLAAHLQMSEPAICALGGWQKGSTIVHKIYIKINDRQIAAEAGKMRAYYET